MLLIYGYSGSCTQTMALYCLRKLSAHFQESCRCVHVQYMPVRSNGRRSSEIARRLVKNLPFCTNYDGTRRFGRAPDPLPLHN